MSGCSACFSLPDWWRALDYQSVKAIWRCTHSRHSNRIRLAELLARLLSIGRCCCCCCCCYSPWQERSPLRPLSTHHISIRLPLLQLTSPHNGRTFSSPVAFCWLTVIHNSSSQAGYKRLEDREKNTSVVTVRNPQIMVHLSPRTYDSDRYSIKP